MKFVRYSGAAKHTCDTCVYSASNCLSYRLLFCVCVFFFVILVANALCDMTTINATWPVCANAGFRIENQQKINNAVTCLLIKCSERKSFCSISRSMCAETRDNRKRLTPFFSLRCTINLFSQLANPNFLLNHTEVNNIRPLCAIVQIENQFYLEICDFFSFSFKGYPFCLIISFSRNYWLKKKKCSKKGNDKNLFAEAAQSICHKCTRLKLQEFVVRSSAALQRKSRVINIRIGINFLYLN